MDSLSNLDYVRVKLGCNKSGVDSVMGTRFLNFYSQVLYAITTIGVSLFENIEFY